MLIQKMMQVWDIWTNRNMLAPHWEPHSLEVQHPDVRPTQQISDAFRHLDALAHPQAPAILSPGPTSCISRMHHLMHSAASLMHCGTVAGSSHISFLHRHMSVIHCPCSDTIVGPYDIDSLQCSQASSLSQASCSKKCTEQVKKHNTQHVAFYRLNQH